MLENMAPYPDPDMPVETYYQHWYQIQNMMIPLGTNEWHQKKDPVQYQLAMLSVLLRSHTISPSEIYRDLFSDDNPTTLPSFKRQVLQTDIPAQVGYEFEIPIFFVSGKNDWQVYYQLVADYYEQVQAPYKEMLWLENSAHLVVVEEPGRFLNFLVNRVLPFASSPEK
jgi:esterase/lipase